MADIVERLRFDAARCEATFSKGVASNIEEAAAEIERLRGLLAQIRVSQDPIEMVGLAALADEQKGDKG